MRKLSRSVLMAAVALGLGTASAAAQSNDHAFQWYVGGSGGLISFQTPTQARTTKPLAGVNLLVMAHRSGLLLSIEQGFTDHASSAYGYIQSDSTGASSAGQVDVTFNYIRKYSAMLMAFPVRGPITPYFGVGGGIIHTGGLTAFGFATDDPVTKDLGSAGFGSALAGLEIRVSRMTVFGQYQVTTGMATQVRSLEGSDGSSTSYIGKLLEGPTHTFSAGLRFSLGNARESLGEQH